MASTPGLSSPRTGFLIVIAMLAMIAVPAAWTLHAVRVSAVVDVSSPNPTPYGYTKSLLLFIVPILVIGFWFVPQENVKISKKSFVRTIAVLFPLGAALDFFFAHSFLKFENPKATLGLAVPVLHGRVPVEEFVFYFTGFVVTLLMYVWLDEYWLAAYSVPGDAQDRAQFKRLLRFHPESLVLALVLIGGAIAYRKLFVTWPSGFPGYFTFLVVAALGPSTVLFPAALPVINWRAFSLTLFIILLTSLLWEATLGVPYRWWGYQPEQMIGLTIAAWNSLPIEAVCVWIAVTYETVIAYEVIKRWQSSGKRARHAFFGTANAG